MASLDRGHFYWRKRGGGVGAPAAPTTGAFRLQQATAMIHFICLDLKQIDLLGRDYPWPRPEHCPCGNPRLWAHGFVARLFDGFARALTMRRYRCPVCGCIILLRPTGYFARHQADTRTIRQTLATRLVRGRWPAGCAANRARHWLKALKANALAVLGMPGYSELMAAFDHLVERGRVPVRRSV